jgi:hypothetical protein
MNMQTGLSFDQAPPFSVPLRFFLTAPAFLLAAAMLAVFAPEFLGSRWTASTLALTHALTIGFLAMAMIGALMQMLPVVAGTIIPAARAVAWLIHLPLTAGTAALMAGFMGAGMVFMWAGAGLLVAGFSVFLMAAGFSLMRATGSDTVNGIRLAVFCLLPTVVLGLALALMRAGFWPVDEPQAVTVAHVVFGLLGWVLLLVIGVAYQVVPMFQITPPYPPRLARWLAGALSLFLIARAAAPLLPQEMSTYVSLAADIGLAAGILIFAFVTLRLQSRRRRKLPDVTLDFWRMGMASLIACVLVWLAGRLWQEWSASETYPLLLGVLFIGGFAISVVNGMLYKIVPFLAWFHLQAQLQAKAGTIPNMKQMIDERWMRMQFYLHLAACLLLVAAVFSTTAFAMAAGVFLALSALLLWINLFAVARRYARHGGRFAL